MKCICIGRNYRDHAVELGNDLPKEPIFFLKPFTAIAHPGRPLHLPAHLGTIHHELELVAVLDGYARDMPASMALGLVGSYTLGLDLTARDVQNELKAAGLPWEKAKAFDDSAVLGDVHLPMTSATDLQSFTIELQRNGKVVQQGHTRDMIFPVAELIAHVSRFITIEPGDLLFTGTPAGVGPMASNDRLEGFLNGKRLLQLQVA